MSVNLLIVEDDDVAAEAIQRSLRKQETAFEATFAEDGAIALEVLRGQHPDKKISTPIIVLLDLNMPKMNGFEFLDALRADPKLSSLVVFVLTTSSSDLDRSKAYQGHIAGYMVKDKVGPQFSKLFKLLSDYAETVILPEVDLPSK